MSLFFDKKIVFSLILSAVIVNNPAYGCPANARGHLIILNKSGEAISYKYMRDGHKKPFEKKILSGAHQTLCWSTHVRMHGWHGIYGENLSRLVFNIADQENSNDTMVVDGLDCKVKVVNGGVRYGKVSSCKVVPQKGSYTELYKMGGCDSSGGTETCTLKIGIRGKN